MGKKLHCKVKEYDYLNRDLKKLHFPTLKKKQFLLKLIQHFFSFWVVVSNFQFVY